MPFTLSHAAAVWPFEKTRLEMSALLIGAFAPDFAYFFFMSPRGLYAHSFEGMFLVDLPLSLIALWLFHAFMKEPLIMLLPTGFRARLKSEEQRFTFWPLKRLVLILVSTLIGTATHILWDSFTHPFYWPYRHLSFLSKMVHLPIEGDVQMYKALQNASTVIGLMIVALWIWLWYRAAKPNKLAVREPYTRAQVFAITIVVPVLALTGALMRAYLDVGMPTLEVRSMLHFGVIAMITATTFCGAGLVICGAIFRPRVAVKQPA